MGRNGMGKTTTVGSIIGTLASRGGSIRFDGEPISGKPAYQVAQLGIGLVPEGRQIFPKLCRCAKTWSRRAANRDAARDPWTLDAGLRAVSAPRRAPAAGQLGQPAVRRRTADAGHRPRADDQSAPAAARPHPRHRPPRASHPDRRQRRSPRWSQLADRLVVLVKGEVVFAGPPAALLADEELMHRHLGV